MKTHPFEKGDRVRRTMIPHGFLPADVEPGAEGTVAIASSPRMLAWPEVRWDGTTSPVLSSPKYMEKVEPEPTYESGDKVVFTGYRHDKPGPRAEADPYEEGAVYTLSEHKGGIAAWTTEEVRDFSWFLFDGEFRHATDDELAGPEPQPEPDPDFHLAGRHVGVMTDEGGRIVPQDQGPWSGEWDCITSAVAGDAHTFGRRHRLVLDIDYAARLIPSTTEGHFHLYLDGHTVSHEAFLEIMEVLGRHGVVQPSYADHCREQGFATVRPPWIRKDPSALSYADYERAVQAAQDAQVPE